MCSHHDVVGGGGVEGGEEETGGVGANKMLLTTTEPNSVVSEGATKHGTRGRRLVGGRRNHLTHNKH